MSGKDSLWPRTRWTVIGRSRGEPRGEERARAWEELIELYRRPIDRVLRRYLAGEPNVDEAVDSFFGYLFEHKVFDKPREADGRFRAYVQAVARNFARNWRRRDRGASLDEGLLEGLAEEEPDHEAWIPTLVEQAIERLGPEDAELVRAFYGIDRDGALKCEVIAKSLGKKVDAVYQRLHAARQRLRDELGRVLADLAADQVAWSEELEWAARMLERNYPAPGRR